jgi:sucrose synthase
MPSSSVSQAHRLLHHIIGLHRPFLLRSDLTDAVDYLCEEDASLADTALARALHQSEEAAIDASWIYLALRRRVARWDYLRIHLEAMDLQQVGVDEYLNFKEHLATGGNEDPFGLEIDLEPFYRDQYKLQGSRSQSVAAWSF